MSLTLLQFSQPKKTWPVTILWPADAAVAVIGEQWTRRADGQIEAVYQDKDELGLALQITRCIREPSPPREQAELIPLALIPLARHNYMEA